MSLKIDRLQLEIIINNDQSRKQLRELNDEALKLQKSMKGMAQGSDEYVTASKRLSSVKDQMDGIYHKIGITGLTLKELTAKQKEFNMVLNNLDPNVPQYKAMKVTLDEINARIKEVRGTAQSTKDSFGAGGMLGSILGIAGGFGLESMVEKAFGTIKKVFIDAAKSTEETGNKLEKAFTQADWAYQSLMRTFAEGGSAWSSVLTDMSNAITKAGEYKDIIDELEKRQRSFDMQQADRDNQISILSRVVKDKSEDALTRANAGLAILKLENKGLSENDRLKRKALDASALKASVETGLSAAQVIQYELNYNANTKLITAAEEYNRLLERKKQLQKASSDVSGDLTTLNLTKAEANETLESINKKIESTDMVTRAYAQTVTKMGHASKETLNEVSKSYSDMEHSAANMRDGHTRAMVAFGAAMNEINSDGKKKKDGSANDAKKQEDERLRYLERYKDFMAEIILMENTNFAEKLSQTQAEIKAVNDKYDAEIRKIDEFKEKNAKIMAPGDNAVMDFNKENLNIARDAQTKQVLEQAELDFSEKVKNIHEALRVARLSITEREIYDINKKYDDSQKEILNAIQYRYDQEVKAANGDVVKLAAAEKNKADELAKIQASADQLSKDRKAETDKAIADGEVRFEQELNNLKLKSDQNLAKGKEKIQLEINAKYQKLLDENVKDEEKTKEIKAQMEAEYQNRVLKLNEETNQKLIEKLKGFVSEASQAYSSIVSAQNEYENQGLKKDEQSNNKKKDNLKKQLDSKKITQKQYDVAINKMDVEADAKKKEIEHKQAVRQKEMAIFNATIALIQAVIQAANIAPPADIVMPIIIAAAMGIELAALIATPVPTAAKGRYSVMGDDGHAYQDLPYIGAPKTGLYEKPFIGAEKGREIVIDNPTTENLIMNYPHIIRGINMARMPQYASGKYFDAGAATGSTNVSHVIVTTDPVQTAAINRLNDHLDKGLMAQINYDTLVNESAKVNSIYEDTKK